MELKMRKNWDDNTNHAPNFKFWKIYLKHKIKTPYLYSQYDILMQLETRMNWEAYFSPQKNGRITHIIHSL